MKALKTKCVDVVCLKCGKKSHIAPAEDGCLTLSFGCECEPEGGGV